MKSDFDHIEFERLAGREVKPMAVPGEMVDHEIDENPHLARQAIAMRIDGVDIEFDGLPSGENLDQAARLNVLFDQKAGP